MVSESEGTVTSPVTMPTTLFNGHRRSHTSVLGSNALELLSASKNILHMQVPPTSDWTAHRLYTHITEQDIAIDSSGILFHVFLKWLSLLKIFCNYIRFCAYFQLNHFCTVWQMNIVYT